MKSIQEYHAYIKNNPEGYWFKRKVYGWGWTPVTWQGRIATVVYMVMLLIGVAIFDGGIASVKAKIFVGITTLLFIALIYKTGQKPRWQWGVSKEKQKNESL